MNIWRINLKPAAIDGIDPRKFCIKKRVLGIGWAVGTFSSLNKNDYYHLGHKKYYENGDRSWWPAMNAVLNRMKIGDLCWTRDWDGEYYLGRISGEWEYRSTKEHMEADIINVRPCDWLQIGSPDSVPGKVLNSFRAGRTVQAVHDNTAKNFSKFLYNKKSNSREYDLGDKRELNLFDLIAPDDCEDIVGIYLQKKCQYTLIPSTCKKDTEKKEFVLKNVKGEKAFVQVKQGAVELDRNQYHRENSNANFKWFLFATSGNYSGNEVDYIDCLDPLEIENFAFNNRELMSDRVQNWIELINELSSRN